MLDGKVLGDFSRRYVDELRETLSIRPHASTLDGQPFLDANSERFLLSLDPYDRAQHHEFRDLIDRRLGLTIQYQSLYGGKQYTAHAHQA
jgi:hypothetical protein